MCVCVRVRACARARVCVCVCVCIYIYIYLSMHTRIKSISGDLPHHIFPIAHFPRGLICIYYQHNVQILFNVYV
jgi:hypothetical protein